MSRINVPLDTCELGALVHMARLDCRHPREQLRYLLREEAIKRGLLDTVDHPSKQIAQTSVASGTSLVKFEEGEP